MPLSDYRDSILNLLEENFFDDSEVIQSITWSLYKGQGVATQDFTIADAALVKHEVIEDELESGVMVQRVDRRYIIKETSLPEGVTFLDLTRNDRITADGKEFQVTDLNKTLQFVIYVRAVGSL